MVARTGSGVAGNYYRAQVVQAGLGNSTMRYFPVALAVLHNAQLVTLSKDRAVSVGRLQKGLSALLFQLAVVA